MNYEENQYMKKGELSMSVIWGGLMVVVGLFILICSSLKSEFIIYRLLVARSKILWGERVYRFHQMSGVLIIGFGIAMVLGYI